MSDETRKMKSENIVPLTEVGEKFFASVPKQTTAFEAMHPEFSAFCLANKDHEIFEYMNMAAKFWIESYTNLANPDRPKSARFWQATIPGRLMFYRLLLHFTQVVKSGSTAVGVPQKELVTLLANTCHVSDRTIHQLIDDAIDAGFAAKTTWWRDNRITVIYLTPRSVADYADVGCIRHFRAVIGSGGPEAHQRFEKVLEENGGQLELDFTSHAG